MGSIDRIDDRKFATAEDILQAITEIEYEDVQLRNGKWVTVRPLNRKQALQFKSRKIPRDVFEQKIISMALVEPKMTQAQIAAWQEIDKADGDLHMLTNLIVKISGMSEEGPKSDKPAESNL